MDTENLFIGLIVAFYCAAFVIAFYIRTRKIFLIRQIKKTGRVISLSQTIISAIIANELDNRPIRSPAGLPPPPPYTIEAPVELPTVPRLSNQSVNSQIIEDSPPPYSAIAPTSAK